MIENVTWIKMGITISVGVSVKIQKNISAKKVNFCNPAKCSCENCKYARRITGDSVITCDQITEETKTIPTKSTSAKTIPIKKESNNISNEIDIKNGRVVICMT